MTQLTSSEIGLPVLQKTRSVSEKSRTSDHRTWVTLLTTHTSAWSASCSAAVHTRGVSDGVLLSACLQTGSSVGLMITAVCVDPQTKPKHFVITQDCVYSATKTHFLYLSVLQWTKFRKTAETWSSLGSWSWRRKRVSAVNGFWQAGRHKLLFCRNVCRLPVTLDERVVQLLTELHELPVGLQHVQRQSGICNTSPKTKLNQRRNETQQGLHLSIIFLLINLKEKKANFSLKDQFWNYFNITTMNLLLKHLKNVY